TYQAKNDVLELNATYDVTPSLSLTSQTGYNQDFLSSTEDYNRFNTSPGIFSCTGYCASSSPLYAYYFRPDPLAGTGGIPNSAALFCDPQLGCSDRIVAEDFSNEHAWQFSQELRLNSKLNGPLNLSVGGNYLH